MAVCEIKWINSDGKSTADTNRALYRVRTMPRTEQIGGRGVKFDGSQWFGCCADHFKRLSDPGMHIWECETLLPEYPIDDQHPERAAFVAQATT